MHMFLKFALYLTSSFYNIGIAICIQNGININLNIHHGIKTNIDTNANMERQLLVVHLIAVQL